MRTFLPPESRQCSCLSHIEFGDWSGGRGRGRMVVNANGISHLREGERKEYGESEFHSLFALEQI